MTKPANVALGNKRLLMLADHLDTVDEVHRKKGEPTYTQTRIYHYSDGYQGDCNTPACAWGHYVSMPHAKRRKLIAYDMFTLLQTEFCITCLESGMLFGCSGCNGAQTAKQAAKYIRGFVKARQAKKHE